MKYWIFNDLLIKHGASTSFRDDNSTTVMRQVQESCHVQNIAHLGTCSPGHNFRRDWHGFALFWVSEIEGKTQIAMYPLVICDSLLLKMAIEIVDLPIENGDFP